MKINEWLVYATNELSAAGITTARLDALVLLEDSLNKDRAWLLAHPDFGLDQAATSTLSSQIARRAEHEPLAYIRGRSEFYGRTFIVSPDTLQPRPETETMIELLKKLSLPDTATIADIGTGSGAIAITTKLELPHLIIHAIDIQPAALAVAQKNAKRFGAEINFYKGSLLEPVLNEPIDVLLANLPYVPDSHTINEAAMQEPKIAIFGGPDGLELYRRMFKQVETLNQKPSYILTESLPFQHQQLKAIAVEVGYTVSQTDDFIQVFTP